jgi:hypothetical protein
MDSENSVPWEKIKIKPSIFSIRQSDIILGTNLVKPNLISGRHIYYDGRLIAILRCLKGKFFIRRNKTTAIKNRKL